MLTCLQFPIVSSAQCVPANTHVCTLCTLECAHTGEQTPTDGESALRTMCVGARPHVCACVCLHKESTRKSDCVLSMWFQMTGQRHFVCPKASAAFVFPSQWSNMILFLYFESNCLNQKNWCFHNLIKSGLWIDVNAFYLVLLSLPFL